MTVWRQADRYKIPRIVFVNKMDRNDSNLLLSCKSIEEKLEMPVLCLQLPIRENGALVGRSQIEPPKKLVVFINFSKKLHFQNFNSCHLSNVTA